MKCENLKPERSHHHHRRTDEMFPLHSGAFTIFSVLTPEHEKGCMRNHISWIFSAGICQPAENDQEKTQQPDHHCVNMMCEKTSNKKEEIIQKTFLKFLKYFWENLKDTVCSAGSRSLRGSVRFIGAPPALQRRDGFPEIMTAERRQRWS